MAWRVFGGCDAIPRTCLIARQKIAHGGKVRQHLGARRGRHRKRAQGARSNVSDRARQNVEHDVDLTADHVGECRRRAAIGHMYEVDPCHHLEELAGNMDRCSGPPTSPWRHLYVKPGWLWLIARKETSRPLIGRHVARPNTRRPCSPLK